MPLTTRKCRYCKANIAFARNVDSDKLVPIDPRPAVYRVRQYASGQIGCEQLKPDPGQVNPEVFYGVSHFTTCSGVDKAKAAQKKRASRGAS